MRETDHGPLVLIQRSMDRHTQRETDWFYTADHQSFHQDTSDSSRDDDLQASSTDVPRLYRSSQVRSCPEI